ncbi:TetR/AcrR family transcriptional regulator [Nocardioides bizhenqiangii]|uniref:TetR/AcrR family transcriptional regulator n=1 Tax=Nocardioides bizhenqiangii TaxID=3095076 RepID=A0ABZ0ZU84_9ACTN|nr:MULTISPECIES: TetR/AcrR family transcriptional regulator [unclassified Nocardioides]MDZ5622913.1 TetR/AcrR family transcriptional regulator [Nocardioides sp. HM23]WQQ27896.1 TetR/AcrR family transcriptional regulator [Nocardioides sp. HM61]
MTTSSARPRYHHGDLRNALARAAADLAADGGPDAVTIRGAARAVGVTPTAAYRHFANQADLFFAAKEQAMAGMAAAMAEYLAQVPTEGDPIALALERLISTGRGYVRFALSEPGVFRTCFTGAADAIPEEVPSAIELGEKAPYALLGEMLDGLVEVGYLDPRDRPDAEAGPWAAVHGLAMLLIDGPLRRASEAEREAAIVTTLALVARGLATGPQAARPAPDA